MILAKIKSEVLSSDAGVARIKRISKEWIMRSITGSYRWILAVALAGCAMVAQAVPITGTISIGGSFVLVDAAGNQTSLASSTGIDFSPSGTGGQFVVTGGTGSFSSIPFFTVGSITDFQFSPFRGPISSFWSVAVGSDLFSFDLNSITNVVKTLSTGAISLTGTGTINSTVAGLDPTLGNWSLSGDSTNGVIFGWSSTTTPVPEPVPLALIGIGLLGVGFSRVARKHLRLNK